MWWPPLLIDLVLKWSSLANSLHSSSMQHTYCCQVYSYSLSGNFWRQFIGFNDNSCCSIPWEQGRERWAGNSVKYVLSWRPETHPNRISDCYWKLCPKWPTLCSKPIAEPGVGTNIRAQSQLHLYCPHRLQCNVTGSTPQWNFHISAVCQLQKNALEFTRCEL